MTPEQAKALREPFPPEAVGALPKPLGKDSRKGNCNECGGYHGLPAVHLDYVGHAAVTDRLLTVDEQWLWEPDRTPDGRWDVQTVGGEAVLTGTLTVAGVTRPCVGIAPKGSFELYKQLQSDAIRNGAMRFGVALDLWSKEDLTPPAERASGDDIAAVTSLLDGIPTKDDRVRVKRMFVDLFGPPSELTVDLADQAKAWAGEQAVALESAEDAPGYDEEVPA